ncbi:MAG: T9SS type A sorting domain-containing protein, partial [Candidatus Delongbacteria bacterium]
YPNPFNPSTEIKFNLANSADVKLTVFNARGQAVMNLKDEKMSKGLHTVNFDACSLNSGVYFYKLEANGRSETKKMVLMK